MSTLFGAMIEVPWIRAVGKYNVAPVPFTTVTQVPFTASGILAQSPPADDVMTTNGLGKNQPGDAQVTDEESAGARAVIP